MVIAHMKSFTAKVAILNHYLETIIKLALVSMSKVIFIIFLNIILEGYYEQ